MISATCGPAEGPETRGPYSGSANPVGGPANQRVAHRIRATPQSISPAKYRAPGGSSIRIGRRKLLRISPRASRREEGWTGSTKLRRTRPPCASTKVMRPPSPTLSTIPARSAHSGAGATPLVSKRRMSPGRASAAATRRWAVRRYPQSARVLPSVPKRKPASWSARSTKEAPSSVRPRDDPGDGRCASKRAAWNVDGAAPRLWARGVAQPSAQRPRTTIIATKTSSQRKRRSPGSSRGMRPSYDM